MRADEPEAAAEAEAKATEGRTMPRHDLDRLFVKGMPFYARHGVYEAERELGQRFVGFAQPGVDAGKAGKAAGFHAGRVGFQRDFGVDGKIQPGTQRAQ